MSKRESFRDSFKRFQRGMSSAHTSMHEAYGSLFDFRNNRANRPPAREPISSFAGTKEVFRAVDEKWRAHNENFYSNHAELIPGDTPLVPDLP